MSDVVPCPYCASTDFCAQKTFNERTLMPTLRNCVLAYKCPADWDRLVKTDIEGVKFCDECQKEVFFCHNDEELATGIRLNRCIAFFKQDEYPEDIAFGKASMGTPIVRLPREFCIKKILAFGSHKGTLESLNDEEIYLIFELLDNLENKNSND